MFKMFKVFKMILINYEETKLKKKQSDMLNQDNCKYSEKSTDNVKNVKMYEIRKKKKRRGHPGLNRGPLDLQSNALPLSYTPS